jgi:thioredoxin 1
MSNKKKVSFKEMIRRDGLTLVDFSAEWCGPCRAMAPILRQVAAKVDDNTKIVKVDIDKNRALAQKLNIMGVPTFVLYRKGKILWRNSGMQSAKSLLRLFEKYSNSSVQEVD